MINIQLDGIVHSSAESTHCVITSIPSIFLVHIRYVVWNRVKLALIIRNSYFITCSFMSTVAKLHFYECTEQYMKTLTIFSAKPPLIVYTLDAMVQERTKLRLFFLTLSCLQNQYENLDVKISKKKKLTENQ